ncbi:TetR/AcrR family transcriptional repressor of nem operon [Nitrobacteraceae bacterium AZCC 2161]
MSTLSKTTTQRRGPGRPREFDMEAALDAALLVFRERGYHAASLGDLGSAMNLTAGSIYKAFSDKRAIFLAAFGRYVGLRDAQLHPLLNAEKSGFDKLRALLNFYVESSCGIEGRRGCLIVGSATELALFDAEVAGRVTAALQRVETRLRELIRLGQSDGSISAKVDVNAAAFALLCLLQGFRVVGKTKRTRAEMKAAADQALRLIT